MKLSEFWGIHSIGTELEKRQFCKTYQLGIYSCPVCDEIIYDTIKPCPVCEKKKEIP